MIARLKLVCHASTSAVRLAAFPDDEPLDSLGRGDLAELSATIGLADRCWTGPSLRTRETAGALHPDAVVDARLAECDYGRWTGQTFEDVHAREPEALAEWLRDPEAAPHGGESILLLLKRVAGWLDEQRPVAGQVLAVTHASVIRAAVVHAIGAPPRSFWRIDVAPLSVTRLTSAGQHWTLAALAALRDTRR